LHTIDLHCHSDRSDGALSPEALIERAALRGMRVVALTDHDTLDGLQAASATAERCGICMVPGVEISVTWGSLTLHVLGLRIDPTQQKLAAGVAGIRSGRLRRAEEMAHRLERAGIGGTLDGAFALAANPASIGRMHFARHLVARGVVKDVRSAFRRYLGEGRPACVPHRWAALADAVDWIRSAGGAPVLAHPERYGLRPARLGALLAAFKGAGGEAIEVPCARQMPQVADRFAGLARELGLRVSAGSDFHGPGESWLDLGQCAELPHGCVPVWRDWPECGAAQGH
jgi:predicted metal-dependent phosphoesterase TrpH